MSSTKRYEQRYELQRESKTFRCIEHDVTLPMEIAKLDEHDELHGDWGGFTANADVVEHSEYRGVECFVCLDCGGVPWGRTSVYFVPLHEHDEHMRWHRGDEDARQPGRF